MSRIALTNMFFGFLAIIIASLGGFFLASDANKAFLINRELLQSWEYTLMKSAHGHLNLFGILHILMGLTMPYSVSSKTIHIAQSIGLGLGTLTMGILMFFRARLNIPQGSDLLGIVIGVLLMTALCALGLHSYGLLRKVLAR